MRFSPAHAATSGSVPFMLRGSKSLRTVTSVAVAGLIGLVPAVMVASPASAASAVLVVGASSATEGDAVSFTLTYSGSGTPTYNVSTLVGGGSPAALTDFSATASPASVTFGPGALVKTVTVATVDDALYEAAETFTLHVQDSLTPSTEFVNAIGTINNNDAIPSYRIDASPITVAESSVAKSTITATLSAVSGLDVPVVLNTMDGTALAGSTRDYTALVDQTITIVAGSLTATKDVVIDDDLVRDSLTTETFTVNAAATNVSPPTDSAEVNITDAQADPVVKLTGGGSVTEGFSATYTVGILPASELPVTVAWNAVSAMPVDGHGVATPGTDFPYTSPRTITIPPGIASVDFTIAANLDSLDEMAEDFAVELSSPTHATLGTAVKVNTSITDTNTAPTVAVTPAVAVEGDSGRNARTYTATLSAPSGREVNVNWASALDASVVGYGHAAAVKDFIIKSGALKFPVGETSQTFTVEIVGDTIDEGAGETFRIMLSDVDGSVVIGDATTITITDDDSAPTITFGDATVKEGDDGSAVLLPLVLSNTSDHDLTFSAAIASGGSAVDTGTTVGTNDYDLLNTVITIPAESTIPGYVVVLVNGDYVYEADETANFTVAATGGSGALITDPDTLTAQLTIENDDDAPDLEINSITGEEGETVAVTGRVSGISATNTVVNVVFAGGSSQGSIAAAPVDFTNPGSVPITILAATTPGTELGVANVMLADDLAPEVAETIIVSGIGTGNVGTVTEGIITIAANDGSTGPGDPGSITLAGPTYRVLAGPVRLTGMTSPNTDVQLWYSPFYGEDDWTEGVTTTSSSTGAFAFNGALTTTGRKFVANVGEESSNEVVVRMRQAATLAGTSTTKGIAALRVAGGVAGRPFLIQRSNGSTWSTVFTGNLMSTGTYYKALAGQPSGKTIGYRVYVYGSIANDIDLSTSGTRYVRIR